MLRFVSILFIVITEVVLATSRNVQSEKKFYNLDNAKIIFVQYLAQYGKSYGSVKELMWRFEIFKETLNDVNKWNAMYPLTVFEINWFSDQTDKEFEEEYFGFSPNSLRSGYDTVEYVPIGDAPDELDYRYEGLVTEVKDQGGCGSCYVFSAIGNIEGQYAKKYGKLVSLSEQQCLDCHRGALGCSGGVPHDTMWKLANNGGCMKSNDYPYNQKDYHSNCCKFNVMQTEARVTGAVVFNSTNAKLLKDALASIGPLSVAMHVSKEFAHYKSGIFSAPCGYVQANHAMVLVGYGSEGGNDYWIIKNSWSTHWGEDGYIRITRGVNLCTFGNYVASALVV